MIDKRKLYINRECVNPTISNDLEVINPSNEEVCAVISLGDIEDTNSAVLAAKNAFISWSKTNKEERKDLTPLRPVLDQYQHNTCFYCGLELYEPIHVDHVIPYQAILHHQVWNLVLSHKACNLDKLDFIVSYDFIKKLKERNEFVLKSDLPFKQHLKKVLGTTYQERSQTVDKDYDYAKRKIIRLWGGSDNFDPSKDEIWKKYVRAINEL